MPHYSVTKAAVLSLSRLVADLYAKTGFAATPSRRARRRRPPGWARRPRRPAGGADWKDPRRGARVGRRRAAARPPRRTGRDRRGDRLPLLGPCELRDGGRVERRRRHRPDHCLTPSTRSAYGVASLLRLSSISTRNSAADRATSLGHRCPSSPNGRRRVSAGGRGARGGVAGATRGAVVRNARPSPPGGRMPGPHPVPARSRPHPPLEAVPAAEGQDAGLHRSRRRPLPDADDAHARDDGDRACRRPSTEAERGLAEAIGLGHDTGHPPFGHAGEEALDECLRERFGLGFRHNEQSLRIAESLNLTWEVRDGILKHTGPEEPETHGGRSSASSTASRTSTTTSTTRSDSASSRPRTCRRTRSRCSATPARAGSTRSCTTSSRRRPRGRHRAERRGGRRCCLSGRSCSSACTWARRRAVSTSATAIVAIFAALADRGEPQAIVEYIAGMTDRFALEFVEQL